METINELAIRAAHYVFNELSESDKAEITIAIGRAYERHTSMEIENPQICDKVMQLVEEFMDDEGLHSHDGILDDLGCEDVEEFIFLMLDCED